MPAPGAASQSLAALLGELAAFGLAIGLSPLQMGLDLLAAGALLGLGIKELLNKEDGDAAPPGWTRKLDQFCAMPLPPLLAISAALEVARPDPLFLSPRQPAVCC